MQWNLKRCIFTALLVFAVAGCSGGGGGGDAPPVAPSVAPPAALTTISGTAAGGAPIANKVIQLKDINGTTRNVVTGIDGKFTVDVANMSGPYLMKVPYVNGYLHSVATATGTTNIHPFTDLIIRNWFKVKGKNIDTDFGGGAGQVAPTATEITLIEGVVRSVMAEMFKMTSVPANFNLLTSSFNADHTLFDKILDGSMVDIDATGANVTVTGIDPTTGIQGTLASLPLATNLTAADTQAPTAPAGLSVIPSATTGMVLIWTVSVDNIAVAGYNIYRGGSKVGTSPFPVYSDTALTAGTSYSYQIEAFDAAGNTSVKSSSVSASTLNAADTTAPSTPTGLTATAVSSSQVNLSWTPSTDASGVMGYGVYRNSTKVGSVSGTSFSDTGLSSAATYTYTVIAIDGAKNPSAASAQAQATTNAGTPSAPAYVAATAGGSQVTVTWNVVSGATSYNIYWSTTSGVTKGNGTKITGAVNPYTHTGRTNGSTYYYVVTAVNSSGESVESAQVSAKPAPWATVPAANFRMPDTNQTTSYTSTSGEDHDYTINPPSYIDNGDGTIIDNVTTLIWQKQDDGVSKTWADAGTYCDNLSLGGQTDWRLPSEIELISIIDNGVYNPSINTTFFPGTSSTQYSGYWSSTTVADNTPYAWMGDNRSYAWIVDFNGGCSYFHDKTDTISNYVRCVRGGQ